MKLSVKPNMLDETVNIEMTMRELIAITMSLGSYSNNETLQKIEQIYKTSTDYPRSVYDDVTSNYFKLELYRNICDLTKEYFQ